MNRILASIVFTVYNQKGYVREALVSALSQSYEPLEIVVSDDGSTDGTRAVIDRVVADAGFVQVAKDSQGHCIRTFRKGDKTVVVNFNEKNRGICANFEHAFGLTHGELIFTFGGDDISTVDRVAKVVAVWMAGGKKSQVLASGGWLMDVQGQILRDYGREVMNGAPVGAFNAYNRCVFDDFPQIRRYLAAQTYEDSIYGLRAQFFAPAEYVDAQLVKYRVGSGVSTGGAWRKKSIRGARAVKASCEQLLIDLEFIKNRLDTSVYEERKMTFAQRIEHEANYLDILAGDSFPQRWRAFRKHGFARAGMKGLLLGVALLFPAKIGDLILRVYGACSS